LLSVVNDVEYGPLEHFNRAYGFLLEIPLGPGADDPVKLEFEAHEVGLSSLSSAP